jgi:hypothetical protein
MVGISPETLKGADKVLYGALSKDFQVELVPVVWHKGYEYDHEYQNTDPNEVSRKEVFSFTTADLHYLNGTGPKPRERQDKVPFVLYMEHEQGHVLKSSSQMYVSYTGNESEPGKVDKLYFHAAAIVTRLP